MENEESKTSDNIPETGEQLESIKLPEKTCPTCKNKKSECICGAPEKYTKEFVYAEVNKLLGELTGNKELVYLGELIESKEYSTQRFSEWATKFEDCQEISEAIEKIKNILENRVNTGGLKNKLNASMAKFNLINNYNWKERTETDLTTKGESLNDMSYERAKSIIRGEESDKSDSAK